MASAQSQKPNTTIEVCQPKPQHSSFGQKISEMTNKAFKGHHGRNQNQLQCYSQTQVESNAKNNSKTETHYYGQTQTKQDKKHGVTKTQITVSVVQAQITQTYEEEYPYGTTTTCFGPHTKKKPDLNNRKDRNLFRRIKNGLSRHNNEENSSSSSSDSDSDSDDEKCPESKATDDKCPTSKASDDKCPKSKNC